MSFGPATIEDRAQAYDQQYSDQLDQYTKNAQDRLGSADKNYDQTRSQLGDLFNNLGNFKGSSFSEQFGALLGGLQPDFAKQRSLADQLSNPDNADLARQRQLADQLAGSGQDNLYDQLSGRIDQNAATRFTGAQAGLQNDLAARGLGNGGAALAALSQLRGQTSIAANEQANTAASQIAQLRQQGLGQASSLYGQVNQARQAGLSQAAGILGQLTQLQSQNANAQTQFGLAGEQFKQQGLAQLLGMKQQGDLAQSGNALNFLGSIFGQQGAYNASLGQQAQASAQARGQFWGDLLGSVIGLAGTVATGGVSGLGGLLGGGAKQSAQPGAQPSPYGAAPVRKIGPGYQTGQPDTMGFGNNPYGAY